MSLNDLVSINNPQFGKFKALVYNSNVKKDTMVSLRVFAKNYSPFVLGSGIVIGTSYACGLNNINYALTEFIGSTALSIYIYSRFRKKHFGNYDTVLKEHNRLNNNLNIFISNDIRFRIFLENINSLYKQRNDVMAQFNTTGETEFLCNELNSLESEINNSNTIALSEELIRFNSENFYETAKELELNQKELGSIQERILNAFKFSHK